MANANPSRIAANLDDYPDLVVIYLGMKVQSLRGMKTLMAIRPKMLKAVKEEPDGLLLHEDLIYGLVPPHVGMRQYWRDFDSLERWARSLPHSGWWKDFLADYGGTGFWHEAYSRRGDMEGMYVGVNQDLGFLNFAPAEAARGSMFSARKRAGVGGSETTEVPVSEEEAPY